jgi:ubiquinone/menaquinone biosynthesis C-methylase UbiE
MLEQAVEKFPHASFFQSAVKEVIPDQASFDVIVCSHSFPYFSDGEAALQKMANCAVSLIFTTLTHDM